VEKAHSQTVDKARAALSQYFLTQVPDSPRPFFVENWPIMGIDHLISEWQEIIQPMEAFMQRSEKMKSLYVARLALEMIQRVNEDFKASFTLAATGVPKPDTTGPMQVLTEQFAKAFQFTSDVGPGKYLVPIFVLIQLKDLALAEFKLHTRMTMKDIEKYTGWGYDVESPEFQKTAYYKKFQYQNTARYKRVINRDFILKAHQALKMVWGVCGGDFVPQASDDGDGIDKGVTSALRTYFQSALDMQRGAENAWQVRWTKDDKIAMKTAIETMFPDIPDGVVLIEIPED